MLPSFRWIRSVQNRLTARRVGSVQQSPTIHGSVKACTGRSFSTSRDKDLQDRGIFDSRNTLLFETLHDIRVNGTVAFHDNPIFGTFQEGKFHWMTYGEWGNKVDNCRTVLKNLGK